VASGGCGRREHMREDFGVYTREAFRRQSQSKNAKSAVGGLDSEEAALIHLSYRRTLGDKTVSSQKEEPAQILLLNPKSDTRK
jgi:hypothetical protein